MAEIRRPEVGTMEEALVGTGAFRVERIDGEGELLDGGDVLKVPGGNRVYVGLSSRSTLAGVERLQRILPYHSVQGVPTTKVLHLKSCVTALPDGTIIGYDPIVDDASFFDEDYLGLPEEGGAHVVILDEKTLLMAASAPKSAEILAKKGYNIEVADISQFEKLEGCVTCLSVRWRK
jgi:dimethylargininase